MLSHKWSCFGIAVLVAVANFGFSAVEKQCFKPKFGDCPGTYQLCKGRPQGACDLIPGQIVYRNNFLTDQNTTIDNAQGNLAKCYGDCPCVWVAASCKCDANLTIDSSTNVLVDDDCVSPTTGVDPLP